MEPIDSQERESGTNTANNQMRKEDRRKALRSNPLVAQAMDIAANKAPPSEPMNAERVLSKKNLTNLIPTVNAWTDYETRLATGQALARKEEELGRPLKDGTKGMQDLLDSVDVKAELDRLRGPNHGFPHAKALHHGINNRWDYKIELGENPSPKAPVGKAHRGIGKDRSEDEHDDNE